MRGLRMALTVAAAVALAACDGGSIGPFRSGMTGTSGGGGGTGSTSNAVSIGNFFFSPSSTTVPVGTTVTWTWNSGGVAHTVTFDDGAMGSGPRMAGSFARTFTAAGTYTYYCQIHGRAVMSGQITVQ